MLETRRPMTMDIDPEFLKPVRREYLAAIASVLPVANRRRRAVYLLAGSDFVTALLLSGGADRIVMIDRLPFHGAPSGTLDLAAHRDEYRYKKRELNFSVEPDLLPEIGCLQYLLWEFEAMGVDPDSVSSTLVEDGSSRSYTLRYRFPGETEKTLIYYEVADARRLDHYPDSLRKEMADGIDCLIRKAAVNVEVSTEVLSMLVSSMDPRGLMFVDDQSRAMLDATGALSCPMSETAMAAIRQVEAARSILFGYNPVSIYQSIAERRRWEVERRYRPESFPDVMIVLGNGQPVDLGTVRALLHGVDEAKALAERDPAASVSVLGSAKESGNFSALANVRYFVTQSPDYAYLNYRIEDLIPLCILDEKGLAEHERIFHPSFESNRQWLRFDLFRHINPHRVEDEIAGFAQEVLNRGRQTGAYTPR